MPPPICSEWDISWHAVLILRSGSLPESLAITRLHIHSERRMQYGETAPKPGLGGPSKHKGWQCECDLASAGRHVVRIQGIVDDSTPALDSKVCTVITWCQVRLRRTMGLVPSWILLLSPATHGSVEARQARSSCVVKPDPEYGKSDAQA